MGTLTARMIRARRRIAAGLGAMMTFLSYLVEIITAPPAASSGIRDGRAEHC
jgi:hypothetical protein